MLFDKTLELGKTLFNRVEVWRIRRQVKQLNPSCATHLLHPFAAVERRIVHDQNRMGLGPSTAMGKKFFYKVLEHSAVGGAQVDA